MRRSAFRLLPMLSLLLLGSLATAQRIVISPQSIVVNPLPSFAVDVWVDRDPSGRSEPSYAVGDSIQIGVRTTEDAFVYLFSVGASGEIVQLLPNRYDAGGRDHFLRAGTTRIFPPPGVRYDFVIQPPSGPAKVMAVASRRELDTRTLASFANEREMMASSSNSEEGFARALAIVVQPLPQASWVTATALYHVGQRPAQEAFGTIAVTSQPSGAEVFIDGAFAGFTPLRYGARAGRYDVEVHTPRHATAREAVEVRAGRVVDLDVVLGPDVRAPRAAEPINAYLGLLPYPGSVVTRSEVGRRDSETRFTTSARLRDVYAHIHDQLTRDGWRRTNLEIDDDEVEAEYRRDGVSFELELERDGRDRFKLEIDFD